MFTILRLPAFIYFQIKKSAKFFRFFAKNSRIAFYSKRTPCRLFVLRWVSLRNKRLEGFKKKGLLACCITKNHLQCTSFREALKVNAKIRIFINFEQ